MAKTTSKSQSAATLKKRVVELEQQNKELKKELKLAKTSKNQNTKRRYGWFFNLISMTMMLIAAAMLVGGIQLIWIKSTLLDTDTWVDKTTQIVSNPSVQNDIANRITDELFTQVDVNAYVKEALPERAQPLAAPIASGIEGFVNDKTKEILASEQFINVWSDANRLAHQSLVQTIESLNTVQNENNSANVLFLQGDNLNLNLRPVLNQVKSDLVARGVTFLPQNNVIPDSRITFEVAHIENLSTVLQVYNLLNKMSFLLPILALAFAIVGLAVARNRRSALFTLIVLTILLSVLSVQLVKAGQYSLAQAVSTRSQSFTTESSNVIYKVLTDDLVLGLRWLTGVMLVFAVGVFLTGPNRLAVWLRTHIGHLVKNYKDNSFVKWLATNANTVIGVIGIVTAIIIVLGPFSSPQPVAWLVAIASIISIAILSVKQELSS